MDKPVKPPFGNMIALQIVLTLTILANVITASFAVKNVDSFVNTYPLLNSTLAYIYIGCLLLTVIACYYLWMLKKFALYLLVVSAITIIALIIYADMPVPPIYATAAQLLLITACLIPAWKYLK